jgi:hypothetical protein
VHLRNIGVVRDLGREVLVNAGVKRGNLVILIRRSTLPKAPR